jgi:hypothetical protein
MRSLVLVMIAGAAVADVSAGVAGRGKVVQASLEPSKCSCEGTHGTIHLRFADGRGWVSRGKNAGELKVAPDGRTVGWLQGRDHDRFANSKECFWAADRLVLIRGRRILRVVEMAPVARDWIFWNGKVAVYDGSLHGPGVYTLIDFESGKRLASIRDTDLFDDGRLVKPPPDWARPLVMAWQ